ncbi:protein-L-isoaspartate(D-aspartate) O-methyltransferase [Salinicoccus sp. ID82-1]|uniref:protein-L-isoaspartate(D-aspartate) O-methyltransferase n=1 Tax=Salinicoccus sp. ID82-1 TaxID=2820269 RepID=UPI001EFF81D1|nr:protein-L-isoaspartate(D-aspartate) O-methyltransferase [Salinicoccus sp. ID82-1]MCG1009849.1 protein-L-isoaspartate(D-aspartate) O-methyltransferase [Salinicoccus sp. ID82-1]
MKYDAKEITAFFQTLDRSRFMDRHKEQAEMDMPFSIGHGQTISQPSLVLAMTIRLELGTDQRVLEIGTGSGFQTALLAKFSNEVYTVERIRALHESAKEKLAAEGFSNIHFHYGDGNLGWEEHAPYDRIMVTAAAKELPAALVRQLSPGGKMIIPIGDTFAQDLQLVEKDPHGKIRTSSIEQVRFVGMKDDKA